MYLFDLFQSWFYYLFGRHTDSNYDVENPRTQKPRGPLPVERTSHVSDQFVNAGQNIHDQVLIGSTPLPVERTSNVSDQFVNAGQNIHEQVAIGSTLPIMEGSRIPGNLEQALPSDAQGEMLLCTVCNCQFETEKLLVFHKEMEHPSLSVQRSSHVSDQFVNSGQNIHEQVAIGSTQLPGEQTSHGSDQFVNAGQNIHEQDPIGSTQLSGEQTSHGSDQFVNAGQNIHEQDSIGSTLPIMEGSRIPGNLEQALPSDAQSKMLFCTVCNCQFDTEKLLVFHKEMEHPLHKPLPRVMQQFQCFTCDVTDEDVIAHLKKRSHVLRVLSQAAHI